MKILHLVHAYSPAIGGSEFLMQQVSQYLAQQAKHDVTVFTTFAYNSSLFTKPGTVPMSQDHAHETINDVKVRRFPVINRWGRILYFIQYLFYRLRFPGNGFLRMLFYGPISPEMRKAVEDFDGHIIAAAPFPLNHMNYAFKNKKGLPVVLIGCAHTDDKHGFHNRKIKKLIQKAAGYIALTEHEKEFLVSHWGISPDKIAVIGVGLDDPPQGRSTPPASSSSHKSQPPHPPQIAFVGQHGLHKGINTLIDAMPLVWAQSPDARLTIAGGTTPFTHSFKEQAEIVEAANTDPTRPLHPQPRITFKDNVSETEKQTVLENCHIFASPSGFESFGITIIEAWRAGKPVVACDIPATKRLVRHGHTGFLVPYKNKEQLAETLLKLIRDDALRRATGENGFREFKKNYTCRVVGTNYHRFYDKILTHEEKN